MKESVLNIKGVTVSENSITCKVSTSGPVSEAFRKPSFSFFYRTNVNLVALPKSIATVPILAQLLPLCWLFDATLSADECDQDFYESIDEFKKGYCDMYPTLSFKGELDIGETVKNQKDLQGSICLFSGGLDAHDTALRHSGELDALLVVRGADIHLKNDKGWNVILRQVDDVSKMIGAERLYIESNFRHIFDYKFLDAKMADMGDTWWHGMQYGIGFLSLAAPLAWQRSLSRVYIASSFTEAAKGTYTCASDPTIDNHVRFAGAHAIHDGYEFGRIDKIRNVARWCDEHNEHVYLRVCAKRPVTGFNCCKCEKCFRTMLEIYALKLDPAQFGFTAIDFRKAINITHKRAHIRLLRNFDTRYLPIVKLLHENYTRKTVSKNLLWLYDIDSLENSEIFDWINQKILITRNAIKQLRSDLGKLERDNAKLVKTIGELESANAALQAKCETIELELENRAKENELILLENVQLKEKLDRAEGSLPHRAHEIIQQGIKSLPNRR